MQIKESDFAELLGKVVSGLDDLDTVYRAPEITWVHSEAYKAAAALSTFDLDQFQEHFQLDEENLNNLVADSLPLRTIDGQVWRLKHGVRQRVIRDVGGLPGLKEIWGALDQRPSDPLQRMLDAYVQGKAPRLEEQSLGELTASFRVSQWLQDTEGEIPTTDDIRRRIEAIEFLEPFRYLVGNNFQGRSSELRQLSDYVEAKEASSLSQSVKRVARSILNFREKPPLMIYGPGGMGKSTLIAKFILDHATIGEERKIPFVYVDFDRPSLSTTEPVTVLFDAIRQLRVQYPEARRSLEALLADWDRRFAEEIRRSPQTGTRGMSLGSPGDLIPRVSDEFRSHLVAEFGSLLRTMESEDKPLLFIVDTFEEIQLRNLVFVRQFWDFLESLQATHPRLRVVLSGRVRIGAGLGRTDEEQREIDRSFKVEELELFGLDKKESRALLENEGVPTLIAGIIAERVAEKDIGASPLTLDVAVGVWNKYQEPQNDGQALDTRFWSDLQAGRIQSQLIGRYLDRIDSEVMQALAYPGFVLRRITPDLILRVLAGPCGLEVEDLDEAEVLFDELMEEITIVSSVYGDELEGRPRADVRRLILDLLSDLEAEKVQRIHGKAVEYYTEASDKAGLDTEEGRLFRAEEVYHRLALNQTQDEIRPRWHGGLEVRAGEELGARARTVLDLLQGRPVSTDAREQLSLSSWERDAEQRVQALLSVDEAEDALRVFEERAERTPGSRLHLLEAQAYQQLGQWSDAREAIDRGIESFSPNSSSGFMIELLYLGAEIDRNLGSIEMGLLKLQQAQQLASGRQDRVRILQIALRRRRLLGSDETSDSNVRGDANREIRISLRRVTDLELRERQDLLIEAASFLAERQPSVAVRAVRLGALNGLSDEDARSLGRVLGRFDQEVSEAEGKKAGHLAASTDIAVKGSATEAWQGFLIDNPTLIPDVIPRVLDENSVAPGHDLLREIARIFGVLVGQTVVRDAAGGEESERAGTLRLKRHQPESLRQALVVGLDLSALELLLSEGMNRSLHSIVRIEDRQFDQVVAAVIEVAQKEGWVRELVVTARDHYPANPLLAEVASDLRVAGMQISGKEVERALQAGSLWEEALQKSWSEIGQSAGRLCSLTIDGTAQGMGILVGPETVLTAYYVVEELLQEEGLDDRLAFSFDYRVGDDGRTLEPFSVFRAAKHDWLIDTALIEPGSPNGIMFGYALLRVAGFPGDEPLGRSGARRGWLELPAADTKKIPAEQLYMLGHTPKGFLRLSTPRLMEPSAGGAQLQYKGLARRGPPGAPLFDVSWNLIGMHQAMHGKGSGIGLHLSSISRHLEERGLGDSYGTALA